MVYSPIVHNHPIALQASLPKGWDFWGPFDMRMLRNCDLFVVLNIEGALKSDGVKAEMQFWERLGRVVHWMAPVTRRPGDYICPSLF